MTESPARVVFRDPQQKLATRVADLLARLSLPQKVALLHQYQAPVPELGLAAFRTGTEGLHGVAWLGVATAFPQVIGLASSWDPDLLRRVGTAVGTEVRAMHHADPAVSLNVWAPVVNLLRDPRWGRNEEGYAEDPWLTGVLSTAYAGGLRGDHPQWLRTAPTLKHFLAYNNETERHLTSSNLPPRVLHEYELPAFRPAIESGAAVAVMASYNLINGRPAHVSPLINEVLRDWAEDDVMVVGDAYAVHNLGGDQHWADDHVAGFAAALRAGVDCVTEEGPDAAPTVARFTSALDRGLITESDVDAAVRHILSVRIRLGEFNPDEDPYRGTGPEAIDCPAHRELAREAARASIVLLSNDGILPLDPARSGRIAVIGPLGDAVFEDWYSGTPPYRRTLRESLGDVLFHEGVDRVVLRGLVVADQALRITDGPGSAFDILDWGQETISLRAVETGLFVGFDGDRMTCDQPGPNGWEVKETFTFVPVDGGVALRHEQTARFLRAGPDGLVRPTAADAAQATVLTVDVLVDGVTAAAELAATADVVVLALGNHPMVCGRETVDRRDLDLPGTQDQLLRAVRAANPRTVMVLTSSYPYAIGWAREHLPAVVWSAHGGQEHGAALADVLFGAEPSGRLTQTWYADDSELPDLLDYDIIATDATYLYHRGTPLFPFGHGLSYTSFRFEDLASSTTSADAAGTVTVSVDVVNTGDRPGEEVVQLYTRQQRSRVKQPLRRLRGYRRVRLAPGERTRVTFHLDVADLAFWDVTRSRWVVETATHTIAVGSSSTDLRLTTTLRVDGEEIPPRAARAGLRLIDNDGYAGTVPVAVTGTPGEALRSVTPDAWALFHDVDLNGGLHQVTVTTAGVPGTVVLRLDDPFTGPVLATLPVPPPSSGPGSTSVSAPTGHADFTAASSPTGHVGLTAAPQPTGHSGLTAASPPTGHAGLSAASPPTGHAGLSAASPPTGHAGLSAASPPIAHAGLTPVQAAIGPVSGIHDLYVLFDALDLTVATVDFS